MDESATRRLKIDKALYASGWEQETFPESVILTEQRAYLISPGRVERVKTRHPKKVDYLLEYHGVKLAVIEAKSDELDVAIGVPQAKQYAELLQIRYTYSTNGDDIYFIDMGVRDAHGDYIIPSSEGFVDHFPTPAELWQMTFPVEDEWRDKFNKTPYNIGGGKTPRYYQENAINNVLSAVARKQDRILLTMATGTGKTFVAFQICWKLYQNNWNLHGNGLKPRILFIADRNILANQATNDFEQFQDDAKARITPEELRKNHNEVPKSRNLYFTIFQTLMTEDPSGQPYYKQYPADFFDFIIIDECHRGGANDESQWRELMNYFSYAYQLGMTATPKREENANTYKYFGDPVYSYSLKQGIEDGYLTPFRVWVSTSNIDTYIYNPDDDVEGEIDKNKIYTEKDFYNGDIYIRQRDEHRVKEFLSLINPNDKTIVFCATQLHAAIIRDMINQHKSNPDPNYCKRVTSDDGEEGNLQLKDFQNNERSIPTILTTSQKLSTGVDAKNVRNIVLLRPINNMVEFKQIIGRGTRLFDDKYYFTIYDFVGANKNFKDEEWDGDPFCPICGNYPCTCNKHKPDPDSGDKDGEDKPFVEPKPCPVCGHLPCTCEGKEQPKKQIRVTLSYGRQVCLSTDWEEFVWFGDELISLEQFIKLLFEKLPTFFDSPESLRAQWSHPETRKALLDQLNREGFPEEKLEMVRRLLEMEDCDIFDILEYLAFATSPLERIKRVELVRADYYRKQTAQQQAFLDFVMSYYVRNGYKELSIDALPKLLEIHYGTAYDATKQLDMSVNQIMGLYLDFQKQLYKPLGSKQPAGITVNFIGGNVAYTDNSQTFNIKK